MIAANLGLFGTEVISHGSTKPPEINMSKWNEVAEETLAEVASSSLNCKVSKIKTSTCTIPSGMPGAFIALMTVSGAVQVQIGLLSSEDGCHELASQMLGMQPGEKLPASDMEDALNEVLNIIAGAIKGRLDAEGSRLKIGFPWFSMDPLSESFSQTKVAVSEVRIGKVNAALLIAPEIEEK